LTTLQALEPTDGHFAEFIEQIVPTTDNHRVNITTKNEHGGRQVNGVSKFEICDSQSFSTFPSEAFLLIDRNKSILPLALQSS
jgi:hypothetical protein